MSSPSSPASISTMLSIRATDPARLTKPRKGVRLMDPIAAKYIGAGIACIGMGGAGAGVGIIFGNYLAAAVRNPSPPQGQFPNLIFAFPATQAPPIFSLLLPLLLLSPL